MPSLLSLRLNPPLEYNRDENGGQNPQRPEAQSPQQNLHMVNPTPETAQGQLPSLLSLRLNQSPTYPFSMPGNDAGTLKYTRQEPIKPVVSPKNYIIGGVDIARWATDPTHEQKITRIYNGIQASSSPQDLHSYIRSRAPTTTITGQDVWDAAKTYRVDPKLVVAIIQQDSSFGTAGKGSRTNNPGNVGNDDAGNTQRYKTMRDGVFAVAKLLSKWKVGTQTASAAEAQLLPSLLQLRLQQ